MSVLFSFPNILCYDLIMNLFALPYFLNNLIGLIGPLSTLLMVIYFINVAKETKTGVSVTHFVLYGIAFLTHVTAFNAFLTLIQSLMQLWVGVKTLTGESLPTDFNPVQYIKQDIAESIGLLLIAGLIFVYAYKKTRKLRESKKDSYQDLLLHKLYFLGVLAVIGLTFVSLATTVASRYLALAVDWGSFSMDALRTTSSDVWSQVGVGLVVSAALFIYNWRKLRALGEEV